MPMPQGFTTAHADDKKRILIVDDDKGMVDSIPALAYKRKDIYDLEMAYDGFEAGEK